MRLVVARCSARYTGRLSASLPAATRLLVVKADGSVLIHADGGSYKPLNWMSPPCVLTVADPDDDAAARGVREVWRVQHGKSDDRLEIELHEVLHDSAHELGVDPGLVKDGVEAHLQALLAEQIHLLGRRAHAGAPGVPDGDRAGRHPRRDADRRDGRGGDQAPGRHRRRRAAHAVPRAAQPGPHPRTRSQGVFAAQEIKPQARVLAHDRGIRCLVLDYDAMRGVDDVGRATVLTTGGPLSR